MFVSPVGTLTRADMAEAVHREIGLSRNAAADMVEQVLGHMCKALAEGENVKVANFGSFVLHDKAERIGRNPRTRIEAPIPPRRVLLFRASEKLRKQIVAFDAPVSAAAPAD